jgi:phenylacetate-CoA ligase
MIRKAGMTREDEYPWRPEDVRASYARSAGERKRELDLRLVSAYRRAWDHNAFYRGLWEKRGLTRESLTGRDDLGLLPTCDITDMRRSIAEKPPFGSHSSLRPDDRVVMIQTTGGTSGFPRPILVGETDVPGIADIAARVLASIGMGPGDVFQVTPTYSTHGAAWIATWGAQKLGATLLPTSSGTTTPSIRQVEMMQMFGTTVLFVTPAYARILAETAIDRGIDPRGLPVRTLLIAGEVTTPHARNQLAQKWGAEVYDLYGTMETLVWSSSDCAASAREGGALGMHISDDAIVIEVLDDDGQPCASGQYGDMTVTSWINGAAPKFRYRMGDRIMITEEPCPCGLPTPRMLPVAGRVDDMLRISAQNIWPVNIEDVLRRAAPEVGEYVAIAERDGARDRLRLLVECAKPTWNAESERRLAAEFKATLAVRADVETVPAGATAPYTGAGSLIKMKRILDRRGSES